MFSQKRDQQITRSAAQKGKCKSRPLGTRPILSGALPHMRRGSSGPGSISSAAACSDLIACFYAIVFVARVTPYKVSLSIYRLEGLWREREKKASD